MQHLAGEVPSRERIAELAGGEPVLSIENLHAGYGKMEILHGVDLQLGAGRSLCMIGPNGAGKSTVLHSIYGFTRIRAGSIRIAGRDITHLSPNQKLKQAGVAYVLQDNSVFPDMTVEENLWMGGYLMERPEQAKEAAERLFDRYERLAERRRKPARVLSG
jgi:branched-chain amino acid transport system ATP-binding protein